jgi:hypothetical protein
MNRNADLEVLAQVYIDGTVTHEEMERLNSLLRHDARARREFAEHLNIDATLAAAAAGWFPEDSAACHFPRVRAARRWLAVAALIAILLGGGWWWQASVQVFARVEKSLGVESLPPGTALRGAIHSIRAGTVEILTARGARIVIEAPAEFRFESAQQLQMLRGRLAADVPPSAKGFTVITPSGDAVDLGTRFGVDVPTAGAAEVHVFEGEVIAKASGAKDRQSLLAGEALTMEGGTSSARSLRSAAFIQPDELRELAARSTNGQQTRSMEALAALAHDPTLIALLDFESNEAYAGVFRTVQGRWPGSRAPEFVHNGDHLKLDVGGDRAWPQLTLAAWVRLDQLGAPYQSLLHTDGWFGGNFGQVHWMVNQETTMRFATWGNTLAPDSKETQDYPDSRTPVISDQGRWVHLATVYDSEAHTVRFYLNGQFDKEVRQQNAYPAKLGSSQIGNWNLEERKLSGRVDELVILGRAMIDDEVRELFEAGNPYTSDPS